MACRALIVLCGATYPKRLWCAWELITLFSFIGREAAEERVLLLPLDEDPLCETFVQLTSFDVKDAHCYDPNEESQLQMVIERSGGAVRFNREIRGFANSCRRSRPRLSQIFGKG